MTDYQADFALDEDVCYLNHAAVSPWPIKTAQRIQAFAKENAAMGSKRYLQWLEVEKNLRKKIAQLIHAPDDNDIALVKNTSEALSIVAYGINWNAEDNIVVSQQEFPSNRIVWQSLKEQGVELRMVDLFAAKTPEDALLAAMDSNTRLLSVSSVQYSSGLRMDLKRLGQACKSADTLFCVDAIQSLGALEFDVQEINADFVMADGHKWLISPEGLGLFYCRAGIRPTLALKQYGWHMTERQFDFDSLEWEPAHTARRFECGSPNMLGIHALDCSLEILLERKIHCIEQQVIANNRYLIDKLSAMKGMELVSDSSEKRISGIVACRHATVDAEKIYQQLMDHNVICALRGGCLRFSPHYYTSKKVLDKSMLILEKVINKW